MAACQFLSGEQQQHACGAGRGGFGPGPAGKLDGAVIHKRFGLCLIA
jgi:hypothetical protein